MQDQSLPKQSPVRFKVRVKLCVSPIKGLEALDVSRRLGLIDAVDILLTNDEEKKCGQAILLTEAEARKFRSAFHDQHYFEIPVNLWELKAGDVSYASRIDNGAIYVYLDMPKDRLRDFAFDYLTSRETKNGSPQRV